MVSLPINYTYSTIIAEINLVSLSATMRVLDVNKVGWETSLQTVIFAATALRI